MKPFFLVHLTATLVALTASAEVQTAPKPTAQGGSPKQLVPGASPGWAHPGSDLVPDPAATWGALPNGLRYVILPHADPPGRVSLRLFVDAGSLMEEDDQQGLAHFLEHMAFNGTRNYPPNVLVEYLQRLGMGFGSDTNAHTFFKETVYKLELPKT
ncbi:MAG: insulinase family protein, partial [Verrucomicrobiales bacterium]